MGNLKVFFYIYSTLLILIYTNVRWSLQDFTVRSSLVLSILSRNFNQIQITKGNNLLFLFINVSADIGAGTWIPSGLWSCYKIFSTGSYAKFCGIIQYSQESLDKVFPLRYGFRLIRLSLNDCGGLQECIARHSMMVIIIGVSLSRHLSQLAGL